MNLNPEQEAAIKSNSRLTMVVAGPGSGKTRTLVARYEWLLQGNVPPEQICLLTFTNEAAGEISTRINAEGLPRPGFVGTLHAAMFKFLRMYCPELACISAGDADSYLFNVAEQTLDYELPRTDLLETRRQFWRFAGGLTPRDMTPANRAVQLYYQQLSRECLIDFDGLLWRGLSSLKDNHETELVWPWAHILIDEWQDAAKVDVEIYSELNRLGFDLFTVGDPNQSIFQFRGAVGRDEFLPAENWVTFHLMRNYRNGRRIVEHTNLLIQNNPDWCGHGCEEFLFSIPEREQMSGSVSRHREGTEDMHDERIMRLIRASGFRRDQIAVLARTNAVCDSIRQNLQSIGEACEHEEKLQTPHDWPLALAALSCMACPSSRFLFSLWEGKARKLKAGRMEFPLPASLPTAPDKAIAALFLFGVCYGTTSTLAAWLAENPCETLQDLIVGVNAHYLKARKGTGVFVGTIHASKGREWDMVIVAGFEQGLIPWKTAGGRQVEEERRLLYVAMTRAREEVHLVSACQRTPKWGRNPAPVRTQPSMFEKEIFPSDV